MSIGNGWQTTMKTYVYCPRPSSGALELVRALGATRLRRFDGMNFWQKKLRVKIDPGDVIVSWGADIPKIGDIHVLNSCRPMNKLTELTHLSNAGVATPKYWTNPGEGRLGRLNYHVGGNDLLTPPEKADYFTSKEMFLREFRIHSFGGKSIRAGVKMPRAGFTVAGSEALYKEAKAAGVLNLAHPWIKSYDAGWYISYDGFTSSAKAKKTAHTAVEALGLTFGAVDLGEKDDGTIMVLEVNRAPGLEGGTIDSYVRAIEAWIETAKKPKPAEAEGALTTQDVFQGLLNELIPPQDEPGPLFPPDPPRGRANPIRPRDFRRDGQAAAPRVVGPRGFGG